MSLYLCNYLKHKKRKKITSLLSRGLNFRFVQVLGILPYAYAYFLHCGILQRQFFHFYFFDSLKGLYWKKIFGQS